MWISSLFESGNYRADIFRTGKNAGSQPNGPFRERPDGFMRGRCAVQANPAQYPEFEGSWWTRVYRSIGKMFFMEFYTH
jgi:hypothetical protein